MAIAYQAMSIVDLHRLFDVVGIPKRVAVPILKEIVKWEQRNGPEFVVERLKNLKTLFLQHYGGNTDFRLSPQTRIACHKSDGQPKGPFRALWTLACSRRTVNRVTTALMTYSTFVKKEWFPTIRQTRKFRSAVLDPRPAAEKLPEWSLSSWLRRAYQGVWERTPYDPPGMWTSSEKKVLHFSRNGLTMVQEGSITLDDHIADAILGLGGSLYGNHEVKLLLGIACDTSAFATPKMPLRSFQEELEQSTSPKADAILKTLDACQHDPLVGSIGFIQERGFKLRTVANPFRAIQIALSRLKNYLERIGRTSLPWDCTFDQDKGVRWAERKLSQGKRLYAFDLSSATDTIPLVDQIDFLRIVGPCDDESFLAAIQLLEIASRARWKLPNLHGEDDYLSWAKGQPMGLGPSFGLFAHTHGARLHHLARLNGFVKDSFVVLGDDVIVEECLAEPYYRFVTEMWGCDISEGKTLASNSLTEFASKLITADGNLKAFKFPKHRRLFSTNTPLELLTKYGRRAIVLVPRRFRGPVQVLASLPQPQGLGIKWKDDEVLIGDSRGGEEILQPNKLERLHDVARFETFRRKGARYDSVVVRTKSYQEREQDLMVAFKRFKGPGSHISYTDMIMSKRAKSESSVRALEEFRKTPDPHFGEFTTHQIQWLILHLNANLENEDVTDLYNDCIDLVTTPKRYWVTRSSEFEAHQNLVNPMTAFRKKVSTWVKTTIRFWVFTLWLSESSKKSDDSQQ
jgi:hypothetical protein